MEYLGIYDKSGQYTGRKIERGDKNLKVDEYIKLTVIWVKAKDTFLIQKASREKGSDYCVTGGHVTDGNNSFEQALLEFKEEMGFTLNPQKLKPLGSIFLNQGIFDVYMYEDDDMINAKFNYQAIEVEDSVWLTKKEIEKLIKKGNFRKSSEIHYNAFIKYNF